MHTVFQAPLSHHSDLGIIGKAFSSCKTQVQMMLHVILIKGDDARRETKANAFHSWLWLVRESMG